MKYRKIAAIIITGLLLTSSSAVTALAEEDKQNTDTAIGGITLMINEYYNNMETQQTEEIYVGGIRMSAVHRVPSPYENLGIANVKNYVNIRSGTSTDYKVIGKLYNGCVANILEYEGDWVKIQSGNVTEGYIKAEYLLIGWDAEEKIEQYCEKVATVNCKVLNVRSGQGTNFSIYDKIPYGESYYVANEYEEWVEIILGQDDNSGRETTGFVAKEYVDMSYEFRYAVTIEEEQARIRAEEAAKKAEQNVLESLLQKKQQEKRQPRKQRKQQRRLRHSRQKRNYRTSRIFPQKARRNVRKLRNMQFSSLVIRMYGAVPA